MHGYKWPIKFLLVVCRLGTLARACLTMSASCMLCVQIIISSRSQTLEAAAKMDARGVAVVPLIESAERDERQTLFLLPETLSGLTPFGLRHCIVCSGNVHVR